VPDYVMWERCMLNKNLRFQRAAETQDVCVCVWFVCLMWDSAAAQSTDDAPDSGTHS